MGIHTGEAQRAGDDYLGLEVHRAARVASAAHGGQVLVTDATDGVARALWGLGEHYVYRREDAQAEAVLSSALEVFERRGDGFWIGWTRFTRAFGRAMSGRIAEAGEDVAVALREFRASRDVSGAVLVMAALSSLLLLADRPLDGYAVGAASQRAVAETGLHIASLWPVRDIPLIDPDTTVPELRAAAAAGAAWSRDEALEQAIALADELAGASSGSAGPA